jgi:hypothetical protein
MKYDFNKCTKEQLVEFFETCYRGNFDIILRNYDKAKMKVFQAAEVKLRTRAEVDADIAKVIREYHKGIAICGFQGPIWINCIAPELDRLCKEETQG